MKTSRRRFLKALVSAVVLAPTAGRVLCDIGDELLLAPIKPGLEGFITSNVWSTNGVMLTERAFQEFLDIALRDDGKPRFVISPYYTGWTRR